MQYEIKQFAPVLPNLGNDLLNTYIYSRDRREAQQAAQAQAEQAMAVQAQERAKAEASAADKAYMSDLFMKAHQNPTWENRSLLLNEEARRNPASAKAIIDGYAALDEATQKTVLRDSSNILTAFDTDPEKFGIPLLEELANAAENSKNEVDAKGYRDMVARAKAGPAGVMAVKDFYTRLIGSIDPEALKSVSEVGQENRARAAEPTVQAKRLLDAEYTKEQTNKIMAETRKLDAETQGLIIDLATKKKSGGLTDKDLVSTTIQLNNTVNTRTAGARTAQTSYENIRDGAATGDGVGDLAIVNTFMRMLSPGIVTEQDYNAATASGGWLDQIKTLKAKVEAGSLLTPEQRTKFTALAKKYADNAVAQSENQLKTIYKIVDDLGIPRDRVFNTSEETTAAPTTGMSPTANVVGAPAGVGKAVPGTSATVKQPVVTGDI